MKIKAILSLLILTSIAFTPVLASAQNVQKNADNGTVDANTQPALGNTLPDANANDNLVMPGPGTGSTDDDNATDSTDDSEGLSSDDSTATQ